MRVAGKLILFFIFLLAMAACFEPPHFSSTPVIDTPVMQFADVTDPALEDSLTLTINFKDGDGDLGLDADADLGYPYNNKDYFDLRGQAFDFGVFRPTRYFRNGPTTKANDTLISYSLRRTSAKFDTLPAFTAPFDCSRYSVVDSALGVFPDTLYTYLNPNYYNIFVDVYVQENGKYAKFDFDENFFSPNCVSSGFNSRFPLLNTDAGKPAPLEGKIQYAMTSSGWRTFFDQKTIQLHVQIQDRALHRSNILITNGFKLDDIRVAKPK